jgi:hypothetical protein
MMTVTLPTLHSDQVKAFEVTRRNRFSSIRCGRRWGKTMFAETLGCDAAVKGRHVGWFAPEFKYLTESYRDIADILDPVWASSRSDVVFRTTTGGSLTFWSLDNERAGRGRRYHLVIIDEAGFTKAVMRDVWRKAIRPTLVDHRGRAVVLSNTNGVSEDNFLWQISAENDAREPAEQMFVEYHAPTHNNPYLPKDEIEELERTSHPLVYRQEYLAEFVDWSGVQFFNLENLLVDGAPLEVPASVEATFATVDTAVKTGKEHDGTGVVFWAIVLLPDRTYLLVALDWDLIQIEGALLEAAEIGLIREAGGDGYAFQHAMTQHALYAELPSRRKRRLHRAVGETIERISEDARQRRSAELAWHFLEGDDPERALPYATLAGDQAETVFAHREAEQQYQVALELARNSGDTSAKVELLEKLGSVLKNLGWYDDALAILEQAAGVRRELNDL